MTENLSNIKFYVAQKSVHAIDPLDLPEAKRAPTNHSAVYSIAPPMTLSLVHTVSTYFKGEQTHTATTVISTDSFYGLPVSVDIEKIAPVISDTSVTKGQEQSTEQTIGPQVILNSIKSIINSLYNEELCTH